MNDTQDTTKTTSTPSRPAQRWMRQPNLPLFDAATLGLPAARAALLARICARAWPILLDCIDRHWAMETESLGDSMAIIFRGAGGSELILMPETDTQYPRAVAAHTDPATEDWCEWNPESNYFEAWDDGIVDEVVRRLELPDPEHYDPEFPELEDLLKEDEGALLHSHLQRVLDTCFDLDALHSDAHQRMRAAADPQVVDMWQCIATHCGFNPDRPVYL